MKHESITYRTCSALETIDLGRELGMLLRKSDIVALMGEPGSGKTWFTKGLALGLGVPSDIVITSPSFSLVNEYKGRCALFHIDVYRLDGVSDFLSTGLEEYFHQDGVVVMEWADRWPEILPEWSIIVTISIIDDKTRNIILSGRHLNVVEIIKRMPESKIIGDF